MNDVMTWLGISVLFAIVSAALGLIIAFPVMWLWNAVIPSIFGLKTITWIEALCLYTLGSVLFKSPSSSSSSKKD